MKPNNSLVAPLRVTKYQVVLRGISHPVQRGDWTVPQEEVELFRAQVRSLALKNKVSGIAEEMSLEAMQISKANEILDQRGRKYFRDDERMAIVQELQGVPLPSIPEKVAQDLGIPYAACNPDSVEQKARGIRSADSYHFDLILNKTDDPIDPEDRWRAEAFPLREEIWIERLLKFDCWPVLFLCGKEHVEGFASRLQNHGIEVEILGDSGHPVPQP